MIIIYVKLITTYLNIILLYFFNIKNNLVILHFHLLNLIFFSHINQILHKLSQKLLSNPLQYHPQILKKKKNNINITF